MSRKQLVTDTVLYGGATVLRYAVGFFLLPIYPRILARHHNEEALCTHSIHP